MSSLYFRIYNKYAESYNSALLPYKMPPAITGYKPNKKRIDALHKNPYKYAPKTFKLRI